MRFYAIVWNPPPPYIVYLYIVHRWRYGTDVDRISAWWRRVVALFSIAYRFNISTNLSSLIKYVHCVRHTVCVTRIHSIHRLCTLYIVYN